jgi:hypothetical protein
MKLLRELFSLLERYLSTLLTFILFVVGLLGLVFCFNYVTSSNLTPQDNILVSILLTICSSTVSLIITHIYASYENKRKISDIKSDYSKNLQIYARKASEKVDNLSNELTKLSLYLKDELENEEDSLEHDVFVKKERMQSAIQIIGTLKSINDKSLSDWQGVIPEELIERDEDQRETTEELIEAISKLKAIQAPRTKTDITLVNDITSLQRKLDYLIFSKTGSFSLNTRQKMLKTKVASICPNCKERINYKQRPLPNSVKSFKCQFCEARLISRWDEDRSFYVEINSIDEKGRSITRKGAVDERLVEEVRKLLPEQPWPKGTSKNIQEKLNLSGYKTKKIIKILIERGVFKNQIDGKLVAETPKRIERSL